MDLSGRSQFSPDARYPPFLAMCDVPYAPWSVLRLPPGEPVRVSAQTVAFASNAGAEPVLQLTLGPNSSRDGVVTDRTDSQVRLALLFGTVMADGWVDAAAVVPRPAPLASPPAAKKLRPYSSAELDAMEKVGPFAPSEEAARDDCFVHISANRYPSGVGRSLNALVCVGAFPLVIDRGEYWSFGASAYWAGPRFDFEVLGTPREDIVPVRLADLGRSRPEPRKELGDRTSGDFKNGPAIDPDAVLEPGVEHFVRTFDLFRCRYYERTRPGAKWVEHSALPDGTPVGPAAPLPPACPGEFSDSKSDSWYSVCE
jgi:hypothetical protein